MTLDEAIKTNADIRKNLDSSGHEWWARAVQLGIEALKCVKEIRHHPFPDTVLLLPGETEK